MQLNNNIINMRVIAYLFFGQPAIQTKIGLDHIQALFSDTGPVKTETLGKDINMKTGVCNDYRQEGMAAILNGVNLRRFLGTKAAELSGLVAIEI